MGFDHRDPGTPAAAWQPLIDALPDRAAPGRGAHVLVLAAHPDDETLGAGGLIASAARAGARVSVVVASDGEASHPDSRTHRPADLASLRRTELRAALEILAPDADLQLLGLPDGRLQDHVPAIEEALERVTGCTLLVSPWVSDGHPDHEACAAASAHYVAARAIPHWQYPVWAWHWDDPGASQLGRADLVRLPLDSESHAAKQRALECHVSQLRALSDRPGDDAVLPPHVVDHFRGHAEVFDVSSISTSTPLAYFEGLYESSSDPWGLESRFYERRKRAILLAALPRERFRRAFEPGCAAGALTEQLAARVDSVVAWDAVRSTAEFAATRLAGHPSVGVEARAIPDDWPTGTFDLVVLSEVGYYCADTELLTSRVLDCLDGDGVLVSCHWRHPADRHPVSAETLHAELGRRLVPVVEHVERDFLLHVWSRSGESVAAAEGIVT